MEPPCCAWHLNICTGPHQPFDWTSSQAHQLTMSLNYIKQFDSMLRCIFSVTDHTRCQNMVRTSVKPLLLPGAPLFCSYRILKSSVIYYWTDEQQHGIYLLKFTSKYLPSVPLPSSQVTLQPQITGGGRNCAQRWLHSTSTNVLYTEAVYIFVNVLVVFFN